VLGGEKVGNPPVPAGRDCGSAEELPLVIAAEAVVGVPTYVGIVGAWPQLRVSEVVPLVAPAEAVMVAEQDPTIGAVNTVQA